MDATQKPLASDPYSWLLEQLREAEEFIPGATIADGLEWALITLESEIDTEGEVKSQGMSELAQMTQLLDKKAKYRFWAPDECWWRFAYEPQNDWSGVKWNWIAYRKKPGSSYVVQGPWTEIEVLNRLVLYGHKLDDDDLIDLGLFVYSGGLEEFLAQNRIPEEEWEDLGESKKETTDG